MNLEKEQILFILETLSEARGALESGYDSEPSEIQFDIGICRRMIRAAFKEVLESKDAKKE